MFWLILGYGASPQAVPPESAGQQGTEADVKRRRAAGAGGPPRPGTVATGRWVQCSHSVPDGPSDGTSDPYHRQALPPRRVAAGPVREAAARSRAVVGRV